MNSNLSMHWSKHLSCFHKINFTKYFLSNCNTWVNCILITSCLNTCNSKSYIFLVSFIQTVLVTPFITTLISVVDQIFQVTCIRFTCPLLIDFLTSWSRLLYILSLLQVFKQRFLTGISIMNLNLWSKGSMALFGPPHTLLLSQSGCVR